MSMALGAGIDNLSRGDRTLNLAAACGLAQLVPPVWMRVGCMFMVARQGSHGHRRTCQRLVDEHEWLDRIGWVKLKGHHFGCASR